MPPRPAVLASAAARRRRDRSFRSSATAANRSRIADVSIIARLYEGKDRAGIPPSSKIQGASPHSIYRLWASPKLAVEETPRRGCHDPRRRRSRLSRRSPCALAPQLAEGRAARARLSARRNPAHRISARARPPHAREGGADLVRPGGLLRRTRPPVRRLRGVAFRARRLEGDRVAVFLPNCPQFPSRSSASSSSAPSTSR